jgi:hypothetical protein
VSIRSGRASPRKAPLTTSSCSISVSTRPNTHSRDCHPCQLYPLQTPSSSQSSTSSLLPRFRQQRFPPSKWCATSSSMPSRTECSPGTSPVLASDWNDSRFVLLCVSPFSSDLTGPVQKLHPYLHKRHRQLRADTLLCAVLPSCRPSLRSTRCLPSFSSTNPAPLPPLREKAKRYVLLFFLRSPASWRAHSLHRKYELCTLQCEGEQKDSVRGEETAKWMLLELSFAEAKDRKASYKRALKVDTY